VEAQAFTECSYSSLGRHSIFYRGEQVVVFSDQGARAGMIAKSPMKSMDFERTSVQNCGDNDPNVFLPNGSTAVENTKSSR
jgi:hypothetical protein